MENTITVETTVNAPLETVWNCWIGIEHTAGWAFATPDWGAQGVANDVRHGGRFTTRMFAKDGSANFDLSGTYTAVMPQALLEYDFDDDRHVKVEFQTAATGGVNIVQTFEPETKNPLELQKAGWQAMLNNFKAYVEAQ